jgi:geranylgeranyl diphosphate synthase type II
MNSPFNDIKEEVEKELRLVFDQRKDIPEKLHESMAYSVFAGGKRLRPILVVAGAEAVGSNRAEAMPVAAAFELIHTYTLIHDDLPAMDDDDLRRGMPTNHKKFGEATAILAGDGLLTLAFEILSEPRSGGSHLDAEIRVKIINNIAKAVGALGTVGGQEVDMASEDQKRSDSSDDLKLLEYIHTRKTGAMITAAVLSGGMVAKADGDQLSALERYGNRIGHAFQIVDDILDVTQTTDNLGKPAGSDTFNVKLTYPAVIGLDESKKLAETKIKEAVSALEIFGEAGKPLAELALYIEKRSH